MNLDYLNKLIFRDKKADFNSSNFDRKTTPYTVNNLSQSFSDVYTKKEHSSFEKKVTDSRQARQGFEQKKNRSQDSSSTTASSSYFKHDFHAQNKSSSVQEMHKYSTELQRPLPLDSSQLEGSYTNFSQIDIEGLENQDHLHSAFFVLNSEIFSTEDQLKNHMMENFSYEPWGSEIYLPNIIAPQSQVTTDCAPPQMMIEQNQDGFSPQIDFPLEENSAIEAHQILHEGLNDKQQKAISSFKPFLEQEGLVSLTVKDLPQSHFLSQQLLNQQSHLGECSELVSDYEMKEDESLDSVEETSEFNILHKTRDHKSVKGSSPNAVDWIEDASENGKQDSSMNFMQEQQKVASSTITENITVIESLMTQMKGRLKRETDLRNSQIDFDIKHKDFGDISVCLQIQDGAVSALFRGEHYEFRNLLRQNLSSISKIFKDMNLECQEHAINIIKK